MSCKYNIVNLGKHWCLGGQYGRGKVNRSRSTYYDIGMSLP